MTRMIQVVNGEKSKVRILVNCIQRGIEYTSAEYANKEAERIANAEGIKLVCLLK